MGSIMRKFSKPWIVITTLFLVKCLSLKNVRLTLEPKVVERLGQSTLHCSYNLEDDELLYSVKWYRGSFEFYRYTPSEKHPTKIFPVSGINVDLHNSDSTQVTLTGIDFPLSGKFSCEVTTEAPISTGTDTQTMLVVKLPDFPPTISVGRDPLDYGDFLRANCSLSPSKPQATLTFVLNNYTVGRSEPPSSFPNHHEVQKSLWSDLTLEMKLHEFHFNDGRKLVLQCIAEIPDLYYEKAVLKLVSARDPVPERVSASNNVGFDTCHTTFRIMLLCNVIFHLPR